MVSAAKSDSPAPTTVRMMTADRQVTVGNVQILLGGAEFGDRLAIYKRTESGIPISDVVTYVNSMPMLDSLSKVLVKIIGISERTLHRKLKTPEVPLTAEQGARAVRFAQVLNKATEVLGSPKKAEEWLSEPAIGLDGNKPVDLLANSVGYELVDELLTRMEYGVYQ